MFAYPFAYPKETRSAGQAAGFPLFRGDRISPMFRLLLPAGPVNAGGIDHRHDPLSTTADRVASAERVSFLASFSACLLCFGLRRRLVQDIQYAFVALVCVNGLV
jgi:hypothetical protein